MDKAILLMSLDKKVMSDKIPLLSEKFKNVPEEKVSEILAFSNLKDPLMTLLLGVFLGAVGAHNFFLKEYKKGILFASIFALSIITMIVSLIVELSVVIQDSTLRSGRVGLILIIISAILCIIVVIAGLIDGLLSYKRTQEMNYNSILAIIESEN